MEPSTKSQLYTLVTVCLSFWVTSISAQDRQTDFVSYIRDTHVANTIICSPDGRHIYAGGSHTIAAFRCSPADTLELIQILNNDHLGVSGIYDIMDLAVSPDGRFVYAVNPNNQSLLLFARDTTSGEISLIDTIIDEAFGRQPFGPPPAPEKYELLLSPDGRFMYWLAEFNEVFAVFDRDSTTGRINKLQSIASLDSAMGGFEVPWWMTITPDGRHIYAGGGNRGRFLLLSRNNNTGIISFVRSYGNFPTWNSSWSNGSITASPDGGFVFITDGKKIVVFARNKDDGSLRLSQTISNSRILSVAQNDMKIFLLNYGPTMSLATHDFDHDTGQFVLKEKNALDFDLVLPETPNAICSNKNNHAIHLTDSNNLTTVNIESNTFTLQLKQELGPHLGGIDRLQDLSSVVVSPAGSFVYVASRRWDAGINVFARDEIDGRLTFAEFYSVTNLQYMKMSPDAQHLYVTTGAERPLILFKMFHQAGGLNKKNSQIKRSGSFSDRPIAFSPDGRYLYVEDYQTLNGHGITVYQRDIASGALAKIQTYSGEADGLRNMQFISIPPDGAHLYWGSSKTAALFDRDSLTGQIALIEQVSAATPNSPWQFSRDGLYAYIGLSSTVDEYSGDTDAAISAYERNLTTGKIINIQFLRFPRGLHACKTSDLEIASSGTQVYVSVKCIYGELVVLDRDLTTGELTLREKLESWQNGVSVVPAGKLALSPDGKNLYAAGESGIATFTTGRSAIDCFALPDHRAYGHLRRGDRTHANRVNYCFDAASTHAVLQFQAYDIDKPDEIEIQLNGTPIGNVPVTGDEQWSETLSVLLPEALIVENQRNELVFDHTRNPDKQWNWGVRQVAIDRYYPLPSAPARGRIKGDDESHINRVIYSFDGAPGDFSLSFEAYDIDFQGEVTLTLNDKHIAALDTTADQAWRPTRTLLLSDSLINDSGCNFLNFHNQKNPPKIWYWGVRNVAATPVAGGASFAAGIGESMLRKAGSLPTEFGLAQNYPNPFSFSSSGSGSGSMTTIRFDVPARLNHAESINLTIYGLQGQRVQTLVDETKAAGSYWVAWDGRNDEGAPVAAGVYFYRLQAGDFVAIRKLTVIK